MSTLPLKWHGGKHYLSKWLLSHMPAHTHYVEPYFGGGQLFFARPAPYGSEVINDLNCDLMNFWLVLQHPKMFEKFRRRVEATPFSEPLFNNEFMRLTAHSHVTRAWRFFIRYRQSRQGLGKDFATLSKSRTRGGINEQANSWLSAIDGLPAAHERLRGVVILNKPALEVIAQEDSEHTLFYLDPPYLHSTRVSKDAYTHEMSLPDHQNLLLALSTLKGKFMLSGYHSNEYDSWASANKGIRCHEKQIDNKASSQSEKPQMTECLWCNF